jgi:glycine/D-amino acid oxidase-like deaminating enzyme
MAQENRISSKEIASVSHDPYWWDAAPQEGPVDVALPRRCDVAIIGAGYMGLAAALTLARDGKSVVVLDAAAPGWGASSRSGGMIGHGHRRSYAKLIEHFGPEKAKDIVREGIASLDFLKTLIADEKIDAGLQVCGRMRGAWTEADFAEIRREADLLRRDFGMPIDDLTKADVRRELKADCYQGGLLFHAHGGVHPALLHRGLLQRARAAGAMVAGHTPVTSVRPEMEGAVVETVRGKFAAGTVVATTNAYSGGTTPALARRIVPIPSFLIATEPLGQERVQGLIPNGVMIVETGNKHRYYRPSPDGTRIVLGGRAALHPIDLDEAAGWLTESCARFFRRSGTRASATSGPAMSR